MSTMDSVDAMLAAVADYGMLRRVIVSRNDSTAATATATSGYANGTRYLHNFIIPAVTAPVLGFWFPGIKVNCAKSTGVTLAALEYLLGSINLATGTFTGGVTMPSKTVQGEAIQTASLIPVLSVRPSTNLTGAANITVTYDDQDGNAGATANLILPNNAVQMATFQMAPHLAAGDSGVRAVTNMSKSAGTVGIVDVFGLLPLVISQTLDGITSGAGILDTPLPMYMGEAGESIGLYHFSSNAGVGEVLAMITGVPAV